MRCEVIDYDHEYGEDYSEDKDAGLSDYEIIARDERLDWRDVL